MQVCIGGSIGKAAITDREVTFNQQINVVSPIACVSEYLFAVMQSAYFTTSMKERAGGTATPIINRGLWDALLIPPPAPCRAKTHRCQTGRNPAVVRTTEMRCFNEKFGS